MTTKNISIKDKNNKEIKTGQIVKIEGGFFKSDNGNFKVMHSPGDPEWSGSDYCLYRINKNGTISKSKNKTQFWPLIVTVSSQEKRVNARLHNAEHATIEIMEDVTAISEKQLAEMSKDELFETFNILLEEKGMENIDGIWKNSTKSEIKNAIECLKCSDEKLEEYLELVKKEYPHLVETIKENLIDFKKHHFNRLHIYIVARELIIENETKAPIEQKQDDNKVTTPDTTNTDIEISFNEEKNGIEIKFDGKPSEEIRENLKSNGFRWSRYQKIWYAKDTAERREFIKSFDAVEAESEPKIFEYPEIEIDDIEDYTIDPDVSKRENQGNWIFRSKETDHTQELQQTLQHYQDEAIRIIAKTEDKEIIYKLKKDLQQFKKSYHNNYTKMITNKANNPSWAVTGRAGRNANKDRKANDRYNNLIQESIKIVDDFTNTLNRADDKIRRISRKENYKKIENTDLELDFKVETKEIDMAGVKQNLRTYNHKNYMIVKAWGCFRIFKDGKEIKSMRTADTLKMAKKALQLILNEKEDIKQAI